MKTRALRILVHGEAGVGKSTFGCSGPLPRLITDVENSSQFIDQIQITWNPLTERPPEWDGSWELCVVKMKNWEVAEATLNWLRSGQHPFRSVSVDSISELQVKLREAINSNDDMKIQHWGKLLQGMGQYLRGLRDIVGDVEFPNPIETMVLVSTSYTNDKGTLKPYLQGQIAVQVPYLFDVTGYLYVDMIPNPNTGQLEEKRVLFTGKHPMYEAKSRIRQLPQTIIDPTLDVVMDSIFGPREPINM